MRKKITGSQRGSAPLIILVGLLGIAASSGFIYYLSAQKATHSPPPATVAQVGTLTPLPIPQDDGDEELSPEERIALIDETAGHPDDPALPKNRLGVTDRMLTATDPNEIGYFLTENESFARSHKAMPRLMFALGRAAWFAGYHKRAHALLSEAARSGSVPANAYLGYIDMDDGRGAQGKELIKQAIAAGFDNVEAKAALDEESSKSADASEKKTIDFSFGAFERPDLIQAFHDRNYGAIKANTWPAMLYIKRLNQTLWQGGDILFMSPPNIMLELSATLSARIDYILSSNAELVAQSMGIAIESASRGLGAVMDIMNQAQSTNDPMELWASGTAKVTREAQRVPVQVKEMSYQGVADARRLALGYEQDPERFRRIYQGMVEFALKQQ